MSAPAIRIPWELSIEHRWAAESLAAAAGARVTGDTGPELVLDRDDLDLAFRHLARVEEGPDAKLDEHGRFPASLVEPAALRGTGRRARAEGRSRAAQDRCRACAGVAGRCALLRRADARHRHALALDAAGPARRRQPAQARGRRAARCATRCATPADSRACRCTRCAAATRTGASSTSRTSSRARGFASTSYVLAAHRDPHDGAAPEAYAARRQRLVQELSLLGGEVGLHGSYRSCDDESLLRAEKHDLEVLLDGPVRGLRFHYLRMRWHEVVGRLDRLGIDYDTTLGFSDRPGPRAGFSFPFHPWDHAASRPARFLELPLLLMDATLAESRYMGLSPARGRKEVDAMLDRLAATGGGGAVLWHNDRFDRVYGRGWGRASTSTCSTGSCPAAAPPGRARRSATGGRRSAARSDRQLLLPAGRRRGSATGAQALPPPCRSRYTGGRPCARRPALLGAGSRARLGDPGRDDGAPRPLPRSVR